MAKLITLNDLTRFVTNIKNLINNESTSIQAKLDKKLNLTTPGSEQTQYVMIKQYKDGKVVQISETGVFTPKADGYSNYMPVLRGLEGQLRGQTPPLYSRNDLDLINRGELTEKLGDVGGGLEWVDYSATIPRTNVFAVIVLATSTRWDDGVWSETIARVVTDYMDTAPIYSFIHKSTNYPDKVGSMGEFQLKSSGVGYAEEVEFLWQTSIVSATSMQLYNKGYIARMLVKE